MFSRLLRFSASYAVIEGVQKGILFLLIPIFTRYMTPDEYGVVASVLALIPFFNVIFSLSIQASITRYYFRYKDDNSKLKDFLGTNFTFLFVVSLSFMILSLMCGERVFAIFYDEIDYDPYIIYALIIGFLQPIVIAYFSLLKAMQQLKKYMILFNMYFSLQIVLMFYTIINLDMRHDGYILSLLASNLLFVFVVFVSLFNKVNFGLKKKYIRESLAYCLPIIPVDGIGLIASLIDRYFILKFVSLTAVGVYFVGYQIALIVSLVALAINSAYTPIFFGRYESKTTDFESVYKMGEYIVYFTAIIALFVSVTTPVLVKILFDSAYFGANDVVVYLAFIGAIKSVYFLNTNVLSLEPNLVKLKTVGIIVGTIITAILGFFMTKNYGLQGAAVSTIIGFFVTTLILIGIVNNKTNFSFNNDKSILFIICMFCLALFCQNVDGLFLKISLSCIVPCCLLCFFDNNLFKKAVNEFANIKK